MIIADKLSKTNRAEFILYLWQVEDLLRAFQLDFERFKAEYLVRFQLDESQRTATEQWYENLCTMLREEGRQEGEVIQLCKLVSKKILPLDTALQESNLTETEFLEMMNRLGLSIE